MTRLLYTCAIALVLAGCTRRIAIDKAELSHLDGFDVYQERTVSVPGTMYVGGRVTPTTYSSLVTDRPYRMIDREGEVHDFNSHTELYLIDAQGLAYGGRFKSVQASLASFAGELLDGSRVSAELNTVDRVELQQMDVVGTILLSSGLGVVGCAVMILVIFGATGVLR